MIRPDFVQVVPTEVEQYGPAAAIVLAHIRYRCNPDAPDGKCRLDINGGRWWRVSLSDLAHEVGMSQKQIRTALRAISDVVVANHFPPFEDQTLAYRACGPDQPVAPQGTVPPCPTGHGTVPQRASAPLSKTTREQNTSCSDAASSETAATANTSAVSDPGIKEPPTQGEPVKHDDTQAIPGLLINLPAVPPDTPAAREPRTRRRRGKEIDPDFFPSDESITKIRKEFPYVTNEAMRYQLAKFIDWHLDKGTLMRNPDAAWRNWMRIADERGELTRRNGSGPASAYERKTANNLAVFHALGEDRPTRLGIER